MSKKKKPTEYEILITAIRPLTLEELIFNYIEAKTGSEELIDELPVRLLEAIEELDKRINTAFADKLLKNITKGI